MAHYRDIALVTKLALFRKALRNEEESVLIGTHTMQRQIIATGKNYHVVSYVDRSGNNSYTARIANPGTTKKRLEEEKLHSQCIVPLGSRLLFAERSITQPTQEANRLVATIIHHQNGNTDFIRYTDTGLSYKYSFGPKGFSFGEDGRPTKKPNIYLPPPNRREIRDENGMWQKKPAQLNPHFRETIARPTFLR